MSKPKPARYRTTNWSDYNAALRKRGSLLIWLDKEMAWHAPHEGRPGRPPVFSDAAIQFCLSIKVLFKLPLRQTAGMVASLLQLAGLAEELGTGFLVRSCVDRLAEDGGTTIAKVMAEVQSSGTHEVRFRDAQGKDHCAKLSVKHATMTVRPPIGKQRKYRHQNLQIIHAEELNPPEGRAPVFWKLITNLPVTTHADAVHKLDWYALRWKIETFFRTLKTGCRIEELRLATADRLANCIALSCVVAWRVSWLTMLSRDAPKASPEAVFTNTERSLLERATPERKSKVPRDLNFYVRAVARLGGYLDRTSDAPPGTTVKWRGLSRLTDLAEGARIAEAPPAETYG